MDRQSRLRSASSHDCSCWRTRGSERSALSSAASSPYSGPYVASSSARLTWEAPKTNADGTPIDDLKGFKVHRGSAPGAYSEADTIDVGNVLTYTVENLEPGTHYFAVTAYDTSGNESGFSSEGSKVIASQ